MKNIFIKTFINIIKIADFLIFSIVFIFINFNNSIKVIIIFKINIIINENFNNFFTIVKNNFSISNIIIIALIFLFLI